MNKFFREKIQKSEISKHKLISWCFLWGIFVLFSICAIYDLKKPEPRYDMKLEVVGHFESIGYGHKNKVLITLANGDIYSISGIMYSPKQNAAFHKEEFLQNVKLGDLLQLVVFKDDKYKYPFIYQLECNGKVYLSYDNAITALQKNNENAILLFVAIDIFLTIGLVILISSSILIKKNKRRKIIETKDVDSEIVQDFDGIVRANVEGKVLKISVRRNQKIQSGDTLLVITVMQMHIPVVAFTDGIVDNIYVSVGDTVHKDMLLVLLR